MRSRRLTALCAEMMTDMSIVLSGGTYWEVEDGGCTFRMSDDVYSDTYGNGRFQTGSAVAARKQVVESSYVMEPIRFDPVAGRFVTRACRQNRPVLSIRR